MDDPVNIAEAIRTSSPTCDVKAHLNYVSAARIGVKNSYHKHVIDVVPDFTKLDIEDQREQACELEDAMLAEIF